MVRGETDEKTAYIQARSSMARELWKSMGKHAKLKEKQKWSEEKLHLENARKLRGIYFIDPEDTEFKETIKNARKKLETSVAPAMPCKITKNCGSGATNKIQTKLACILEANESTLCWMKNHRMDIHGPGRDSQENKHMSDASKRKEKQKWAVEKPRLDIARKLRGIYFIDPDDGEFKDIMKNARRKLEVTMPAAMPCKIQREK